jgi:Tol biopolymer transport system component
MRPDGSGLRRISPQGRFAGSPKWAQGGHSLLYYRTTGGEGSGTEIFSMNLDSGQEHGLTDNQFRRFSPQSLPGGVVGYMEYQLDMHQRVLWAGLAYTSGERSGPLSGSDPSWSPDGAEVVYHREVPNAKSTLPGVSATTP